jgi:hypothetical protein
VSRSVLFIRRILNANALSEKNNDACPFRLDTRTKRRDK